MAWAGLAAGCGDAPRRDPAAEGTLFVLTTDFETGAFSIVDHEAETAAVNVGLTHSDAVARVRGSRVYVVNRLGQDNVTALDAADGFRVLWQRSTGPGSNPQDIAFASDEKAYVPRLELPAVLVLDPRDGTRLGEVDLSGLADADGVPEASWAVAVADRIVVAVGRLDRNDAYRPTGPGALAVLDPATDTVERTIELSAANPWGEPVVATDGRLLVGLAGRFGELDGGIEGVDLPAGPSYGLVVTEAELGGDVLSFVAGDDRALWILVSDAASVTSLVRWEPPAGPPRTIVRGSGFTLSCVAEVAPGLLAVCDRERTAPGVRLFELPSGVERTVRPIDVGLPPWQVRVLSRE
ncbi:MAG: hypothetical protein JXB32_13550 [Deltaproteobacteria bacterium]|nr:hypothetical protein [Deltaproteobacteria bacterium]